VVNYNHAAVALLIVGVAFFATGKMALGVALFAIGVTFIAVDAEARRNSRK
jgi:hypothetical protein